MFVRSFDQKSSNACCGRFSGSDPQRVGSKVTPSSNSWIPMVVTWIPSLEAQIEIFEVWKAPSIAVCTRGGVRVSADCVQWCLWKTCYFFQKRTLPVTNVTNASAKNPSIISHFGEADFAHASPGIGSLREAGQPIHCRSLPSRQGPMPDSTMSDSGRREMVWNKCFDSDIYWNDVLIAFQWCFNASEICSFVFKCLKTS